MKQNFSEVEFLGTNPAAYNNAAAAVGVAAVSAQFIPQPAGAVVGAALAVTSGILKIVGASETARANQREKSKQERIRKQWTHGMQIH